MTNPHPPPGTTTEDAPTNKTCINENCKRAALALRKGGGGGGQRNEKPIRWRKSKGRRREFFSPFLGGKIFVFWKSLPKKREYLDRRNRRSFKFKKKYPPLSRNQRARECAFYALSISNTRVRTRALKRERERKFYTYTDHSHTRTRAHKQHQLFLCCFL